jgi:hypothetical protein
VAGASPPIRCSIGYRHWSSRAFAAARGKLGLTRGWGIGTRSALSPDRFNRANDEERIMTMKKQNTLIGCLTALLAAHAGCGGPASGEGSPSVGVSAAAVTAPPEVNQTSFYLYPNPKFVNCLAQFPNDPKYAPFAQVTVTRGELNDTLNLVGYNIKPGLKFDMFTIEHSALRSDGTPDPAFGNFGFAWYQSDLEADSTGTARVTIQTILLDQIFGFDAEANLPPRQTLHVGFWFNNPQDAAACGFDPSKPTPFNGEHKAGPLAMISVPDATTTLGPLCTKPDTSTNPPHCSP